MHHDVLDTLVVGVTIVYGGLFQILFLLEDQSVWVIDEIDWRVSITFSLLLFLVHDTETGRARREFLKLHDVARQRTSLVGEDVLDLAKLLIDIGTLRSAAEVLLVVKHVHVHIHEAALEELYHLKCHEKRDWHEVAEDKNPTACHCCNDESHVLLTIVSFVHHHVLCTCVVNCPTGAHDSARDREQDL
jgi:hypothetical protein